MFATLVYYHYILKKKNSNDWHAGNGRNGMCRHEIHCLKDQKTGLHKMMKTNWQTNMFTGSQWFTQKIINQGPNVSSNIELTLSNNYHRN